MFIFCFISLKAAASPPWHTLIWRNEWITGLCRTRWRAGKQLEARPGCKEFKINVGSLSFVDQVLWYFGVLLFNVWRSCGWQGEARFFQSTTTLQQVEELQLYKRKLGSLPFKVTGLYSTLNYCQMSLSKYVCLCVDADQMIVFWKFHRNKSFASWDNLLTDKWSNNN